MLKIYALWDECHGIVAYYADKDTAKRSCQINAEGYDITPDTELDYDGEKYWGWSFSYIETIEVIE
jgi:hypothetical protein